ncbi:MAG: NUDIX hydrolase [Bacilli bacterium]
MNFTEKTIKENYIYNGKIINLRKDDIVLPDGNNAIREIVEHPGGVGIIAINDKNEVALVNQFRYPYKKVILEIPAGKKDSKTEKPVECAIRELKEETGVEAKNYIFLGNIYPTPGYCEEIIDIFLATDLTYGECKPDEDEFLEVKYINIDKIVSMIMSNEISDAKTIIGVFKAIEYLKKQIKL